MNKLHLAATLAAALTVSAPAQATDYCDYVGEMSREVLDARFNGVTLPEFIVDIQGKPLDDLHRYWVLTAVHHAFTVSWYRSREDREATLNGFERVMYDTCMRTMVGEG